MNNPSETSPTPASASAPRSRGARLVRLAGLLLGIFAVLAAIFYLEENWRGHAAWESTKQRLESLQEKLSWDAYVPPTVPDDQNFFKAPKMQEWFVGKGTNELVTRLSLNSIAALSNYVANSNATAAIAELILRAPGDDTDTPAGPVLPTLTLDESSVETAIHRLADLAKVKVYLDPKADPGAPGRVAGQWTNVSAFAVLIAVLSDHNLRWVDQSGGTAVITNASPAGATNAVDLPNRDLVLNLVRNAFGHVGEIPEGLALSGAALLQTPARRLSVAADSVPSRADLSRLYPGTNSVTLEPAGTSLIVKLHHVPLAAADYLAWSDQFAPEFNMIRAAAERPFARPDGNYQQLYLAPTPNLTAVRTVAYRLAGRARAFVMRNRPDLAVNELNLLNSFRVCLEAKPTGKPTTATTAAADAAVATAFADAVSSGLHWALWRDADLAAFEEQLSRIDIVGAAWSALETERAGSCQLLATGSRSDIAAEMLFNRRTFSPDAKMALALAVQIVPGGWIEQNMVHAAEWDQKLIDSTDHLQTVIHPHQADDAGNAIVDDAKAHRHSFAYLLAKNSYANKGAALKTAAQAQADVNETLVACALERYRLARGKFPATLQELAPDFIKLLPTDPVSGEPLHYRLLNPGNFLLYSVGWDTKDDNGTLTKPDGTGDWVW
jgi:hypothetical protein